MAKRRILLAALLTLCLLLGTTSCQGVEGGPSPSVDSDGDGWTDAREMAVGTDRASVDTDEDGYWDPHDPNPLDPNIPVSKGLPESIPEQPATTPAPPATSAATPAVAPEAIAEELYNVQVAVRVMMRNNNLSRLAHPVGVPTNDMHRFPDASMKHGNAGVGYVLYLHDFDGDGSPDTNYINCSKTKGTYTCDEYGNVTQVTTEYE